MKSKLTVALAFALGAFCSCDDTTDNLGSSISDIHDIVAVDTASFTISSRSIIADSVLSRNTIGYLGRIKDPETGCYLTSNFMSQFHTLENFEFPTKDSLAYYDKDSVIHRGIVKADSCEIRLFFDTYFGDSLAPMKLTAHEMKKPMSEAQNYYSNFDPKANGYIRKDGIHQDKVYTLWDKTVSDSVHNDKTTYSPNIQIRLTEPYTDKDSKTYNNYGTYIMQKYYDDPANFKNSIIFANKVAPGFYFESKSGLGSMAYISSSQLTLYFTYLAGDSITEGYTRFSGTEEVLQTSTINNDKARLQSLVDDNTCTYIKSPAGIFTELTLPVDDIIKGHAQDSISMAKLTLTRLENKMGGKYSMKVPSTLLMIPKDSIHSFFENHQIANYKNSFLASWSYSVTSSSQNYNNTYVFNNIGNMITAMKQSPRSSKDWNKVVLIPVSVTYDKSGNMSKVVHDMSLSSTRLIGGSENPNEPLKLSVIYSKFK